MEETHTDAKTIKKNTMISLFSLFFQSGYSAVLGLVANFILTFSLPPATFGVYILTLSIMSVFNYFSDIGLAASLVQKKEITDDDVKTTFTVQQTLVILLVIIGYLLTPVIEHQYKLPPEARYLYFALLAGFFFSSLKTIPSIFLERKIQFQKIVFVQIVENTVFYITVSILALAGMGLFSFVYAVLIRSLVGLVLMYYISFWIPQIGISKLSLRKLLSFGLPFQANSLLALVKDDLIILFLGKILGLEAVGYIGWAKRWAEAPIRIIMDNVNRILFPVFSRLQHDQKRISGIIEKILHNQTLILAPIYVGMVILMDNVVELIPKYSKWVPALPIFYIFCISSFLVSFSSPFINMFNALGKVKISFRFMILWTALTWIMVPLFSYKFGMYGFPIAHLTLSITFILTIIIAKRIIDFKLFPNILPPILTSLIMAAVVFSIDFLLPISILSLVVSGIVGILIYAGTLYIIFKKNIYHEALALLRIN